MTDYVKVENLQVSRILYEFINSEALLESKVDEKDFWLQFDKLIHDLSPKNKELLEHRDALQTKINEWHRENKEQFDFNDYKKFLTDIGYLEPEVEDFQITTENVDEEIASQAGPQFVVPIDNARYALNAANARWGSLYDALYGTDAISEEDGAEQKLSYNPVRGEKVIAYGRKFLDEVVPLNGRFP